MARRCSICDHPACEEIDKALVGRVPLREISRRFSDSEGVVSVPVSVPALSRHNASHVSPALARVEAERVEKGAASLLDRAEELHKIVRHLLGASLRDGKTGASLAAAREWRANLELIGKITGELRDAPQQVVNVLVDPTFVAARTIIMEILRPHPELVEEFSRRMKELESGE